MTKIQEALPLQRKRHASGSESGSGCKTGFESVPEYDMDSQSDSDRNAKLDMDSDLNSDPDSEIGSECDL